ncbi:MAG: rod shape-determining protein MreD [Bacilli bacterium]|nr:rod shape-determining protein MreD [Bacilli bacterium]
MAISIIIVIISFLLDGILTNFLPFGVGDLSLFTPLTTLVSMVVIYQFFYHSHNQKKYLIAATITGFLYDLFYTNLLFFNSLLFFLIAYFTMILYKQIGESYIKIIFHVLIIIVSYELVTSLCIIVFNLVPISINRILYKISHSLLFNLIYAELIYIIIKLIPKKYRKVSIN